MIKGEENPQGIITSKGYPTWQANEKAEISLTIGDKSKGFKVYITDLNIDFANISNQM